MRHDEAYTRHDEACTRHDEAQTRHERVYRRLRRAPARLGPTRTSHNEALKGLGDAFLLLGTVVSLRRGLS
jgi:hypothetical protein